MELIIDFYKSLDTLNLIIFWGIIIVIILLLIFSIIMISKNKQLKKMVYENNKPEDELPIKKIELESNIENDQPILKEESVLEEKKEEVVELINEEKHQMPTIEDNKLVDSIDKEKTIETEDNNVQSQKLNNEKKPIEMPSRPYQRNVLREMSLSQTSPIGINRQLPKEDKKIELANDLEESLQNESIDDYQFLKDIVKEENSNVQIKQELSNIENPSPRMTEIKEDYRIKNMSQIEKRISEKNSETFKSEIKQESIKLDVDTKEPVTKISEEKNTGEKYLEEVSRKLAEAEIPDEIERTDYELEQEENAIISYKELMEKKDSIQTIDEEEAIISIEELMNKSNKTQEDITKKEESKLYNLTETEENDDFIKELKQFRNDL